MPKRVDANQPIIVKELRDAGCSVAITSDLGDGFPDIVVAHDQIPGINWLFEVKDPNKPASKRKLTEKEAKFHADWAGQIDVIHSSLEALEIMGL